MATSTATPLIILLILQILCQCNLFEHCDFVVLFCLCDIFYMSVVPGEDPSSVAFPDVSLPRCFLNMESFSSFESRL